MINKIIIKTFIIFSSVILFILYIMKFNLEYSYVVKFCLFQSIISIILFSVTTENNINLRGKLKYINLFLVGYIIVYYQGVIDILLGFKKLESSNFGFNNQILKDCILLITLSLNFYIYGYLSYIEKSKKIVKLKNNNYSHRLWILNIVAIIFLSLYYKSTSIEYFLGGYGRVDLTPSSIRYFLLFKSFILTSFIFKIVSNRDLSILNYIKKFWQELMLIFLFLIGVVLSGDRGPIITFGLLILLSILMCSKVKLKLYQIIIFIFIFSNVISLLGEARNLDPNLKFTDKIVMVFERTIDVNSEKTSILKSTEELSGSINTLSHSINYIDNGNSFFYGKFLAQQILIAIPFTRDFFNSLIFDSDKTKLSSAEYITHIIQGNSKSYGNGSSILADLYLDFGFILTIVIMFFFGKVSRFMDITLFCENSIKSITPTIFSIVYYTSVIYISRSTIFLELQVVCWVLIISYIFKRLN